jgi:hypothetical protein
MKRFIVLLGIAALACDGTVEPRLTSLQEFVAAEGLPAAQEPVALVRVEEEGLVVFTVRFGEVIRTRAGDYYDTAWGVELGDRIGWGLVAGTQVDRTTLRYYEISPADEYLFTSDFGARMRSADSWVYESVVVPLLIRSEHTPEPTLLRIAREIPSVAYITVHNVGVLLDHPVVRTSREILTVLAALPDLYAEVRVRAQELLDALED